MKDIEWADPDDVAARLANYARPKQRLHLEWAVWNSIVDALWVVRGYHRFKVLAFVPRTNNHAERQAIETLAILRFNLGELL